MNTAYLLKHRHDVRLVWVEPWPAYDGKKKVDAYIRLSATVHDCINMYRLWAKDNGYPTNKEEKLLESFIAVHCAWRDNDGR